MKTVKKIKALSPVISVLLLVIIAAVASVMLYVWFSGYFSTQASKAGGLNELSITVQRTYFTNHDGTEYNTMVIIMSIYNPADETVTVTGISVYINGGTSSVVDTTTPAVNFDILPGRTVTVVVRCNIDGQNITHDSTVDIVISVSGTGVNTNADYQATYAYTVTAP